MFDREQQNLWNRIERFSFSSGDESLTFAGRLARENRWDIHFAERVIQEYRRFMFLAVMAGHPVTPSDQVDQAWHLHLTYTRSYWDGFCDGVLGKRIHHGPTKGGIVEATKFTDWYEKTLASYRQLFDEEPPADVWPDAFIRFGEDLHYERVNRKRSWVIPRWFGLKAKLKTLWPSILIALASGKIGCPECNTKRAFSLTGNVHDGKAEWKCDMCSYTCLRSKSRHGGGTGGCGASGCGTSDFSSSSSDAGCGSGCGSGCGGGCGGCGGCGG